MEILLGLFLIFFVIPAYISLGKRCWQLIRAAQQCHAEHSQTLLFLALNLAEPLINTPLIGYLYILASNRGYDDPYRVVFQTLLTLPMAVLAVPVVGWNFQKYSMRKVSRSIFVQGMLRWLAVFMPISAFSLLPGNAILGLLALCGPFAALFLLIRSFIYAGNQLKTTLLPPLSPLVPPASVQAVIMQARPAAPVEPERVPELNYANATPCPICHGLVWLEHSTCPACGLLLASRIPPELHSIPRYEVLRPLGGGGMSSIYLARDRAGGRLYALKTLAVIDGEHSAQWYHEATACLQHEANLLRGLHHIGLPAFEGWYATSWGYFMAMAYVPGPALDQQLSHVDAHGQAISGHALDPKRVAHLGAQVAETLHMLHSQPHPIIHCDIKPANLIVPAYEHPVLVDFGSAIVLNDATQQPPPGTRYGTPGYAAPEQYQGSVEPRSDVYALAATLYHLATDDDPTQHPLRFPKLKQLPQGLAAVLSNALERDAWQRPVAQQFATQLREAMR